jgi:hypothetical protein
LRRRIETLVSTVSVDLAVRSYDDVGVCSLRVARGRIEVTFHRLAASGLTGRPEPEALARALAGLACERGARLLLIDGPQAWKSPSNGLEHSRICERQLATPCKTGLPGCTKPSTYGAFAAAAVEFFDGLAALGWPRLPDETALFSSARYSVESFPTSAWRHIGLRPLAAKARTPRATVRAKLAELEALFPLRLGAREPPSHDELQALVAGLAGVAAATGQRGRIAISGVPPFEQGGCWREGFIVNPRAASDAAGAPPAGTPRAARSRRA